jgi:hypothetical protein
LSGINHSKISMIPREDQSKIYTTIPISFLS